MVAFSQHHDLNLGFTAWSFPTGLFRVTYSFFAGVLACRLHVRRSSITGGWLGNLFSWPVLGLVAPLLGLSVSRTVPPGLRRAGRDAGVPRRSV